MIINLKSIQFLGGGSILHAGSMIGKKVTVGAFFGHAAYVEELTLNTESKIVTLKVNDGTTYLVDFSGVAAVVAEEKETQLLAQAPAKRKYEKKQKVEVDSFELA